MQFHEPKSASTMTSDIEIIYRFHMAKSFGIQENLIALSDDMNRAYRDLSEAEIPELVQLAVARKDYLQDVLVILACLRPDSLKPFHQKFIERGIFYPEVIYHDADERCALDLAKLLGSSGESRRRNHLLQCMAWAGNTRVQTLFSEWRESPPAWAADLHDPPHAYALEAGWELGRNGDRRDLFFRTALPLVKPDARSAEVAGVSVGTPTEQSCPWCGRQLVSLLDIDPASDAASFMRLPDMRLRIMTCNLCSCFGTVFTKNGGTGGSAWHPSNVRPGFLPDDSSDWKAFPERPLVHSGKTRHFMETASWTNLPGVAFSQVGGLPTWIQDAVYPDCPECLQKMLFIGQISNEDFDQCSQGVEYCFLCIQCSVTATTYQ